MHIISLVQEKHPHIRSTLVTVVIRSLGFSYRLKDLDELYKSVTLVPSSKF